jgi:osmotically-inducible protein OsmY
MKTLIATLLAAAAGASFAAAPTAPTHDPATYRNFTQKIEADYKKAMDKCDRMSGNAEDVCEAEAKLARARAESEAVAKYKNTDKGREDARIEVVKAEYDLAEEKCDDKSGAAKDQCVNTAKSVRDAALADAKAGRDSTTSTMGSSGSEGLVASNDTRDPAKANAVDKCAQLSGSDKTACLVDNKGNVKSLNGATVVTGATVADKTKEAARTAVEKTKQAAATVAQKTENVMERAGEKTREVAATTAQKTENALENAGDKSRQVAQNSENALERTGDRTRDAAATAVDKTDRATDRAASKTAVAASDAAITTKVKASIFKEPELSALSIDVDTEKGVVNLSGFVESKAAADKAVKVAKEVEGVKSVKSSIKVK